MSPDQITALGGIITAVIGAAVAWQAKKVAELQARVDKLEGELETSNALIRALKKYLYQLLRHLDLVEIAHHRGEPAPSRPTPPELLAEEI